MTNTLTERREKFFRWLKPLEIRFSDCTTFGYLHWRWGNNRKAVTATEQHLASCKRCQLIEHVWSDFSRGFHHREEHLTSMATAFVFLARAGRDYAQQHAMSIACDYMHPSRPIVGATRSSAEQWLRDQDQLLVLDFMGDWDRGATRERSWFREDVGWLWRPYTSKCVPLGPMVHGIFGNDLWGNAPRDHAGCPRCTFLQSAFDRLLVGHLLHDDTKVLQTVAELLAWVEIHHEVIQDRLFLDLLTPVEKRVPNYRRRLECLP